jgi:predicted amidophosphoribosyltransferase
MALIKCPSCSKDVSDQADVCPACGHPIKRGFLGRAGTERHFNIGCLVVVIVVVVLTMALMCSRIMH